MNKLRRGYTTGSCAAAAAWGAARLASGCPPEEITVCHFQTPDNTPLSLSLLYGEAEENCGRCAVQKDSGDDPDVTNGMLIFAEVRLHPERDSVASGIVIEIDGGEGVGRVTKPGLACAVGQAAINPVPRRMIEAQVRRALSQAGWQGRASVLISIPEGRTIAARTYNPRLGIEGGISVLGTSGIVKPMSEQALIDTIKVEINMRKAADARYLLLTPGNYGETFLRTTMGLSDLYTVQFSNFLGETIDYAVECGFRGLLLAAHIGKLVKVAGGIMNTHSRCGDCRLEILTAHAALCGGLSGPQGVQTARRLMECVTTDDAIAVLDGISGAQPIRVRAGEKERSGCQGEEACGESPLRRQVMQSVVRKAQYYVQCRAGGEMEVGAVMFSNRYGLLAQTENAAALASVLKEGQR